MNNKKNKLRFYVYAYIRSNDSDQGKKGTPYYIGKGCGNRATKGRHNVRIPSDKNNIVFLETNLTDCGALALERRYIKWYGKQCDCSGILRNLANGGEGTADMVAVKDVIGNSLYISTDIYYANKGIYTASNEDQVVVKGEDGKKNYKISKSEFYSGNFEHVSTGLVSILGSSDKITQEEFDKGGYFGVNKFKFDGANNPRAEIIFIYNDKGVCEYKCHGNFKEICIKNNLPFMALGKSYRADGKKIYQNLKSQYRSKFIGGDKFIGWYAKIMYETAA